MRPAGALLLLLWGMGTLRAAEPQWDPWSAQDLSSPAARVDPAAPAEAIFRRIVVDDSRFPEERRTHVYVRYRIFDPERAVGVTRVSLPSVSYDGRQYTSVSIAARLLLPSGQIKTFGAEALRERTAAESGAQKTWLSRLLGSGLEIKERFLAIPGIETGSVLEIQTDYTDRSPVRFYWTVLQQRLYPDQELTFTYRATHDPAWYFQSFLLNGNQVHAVRTRDEKRRSMTVSVDHLAALTDEPMAGSAPDYALTFVADVEPINQGLRLYRTTQHFDLDLEHQPWSSYATRVFMLESDRIITTGSLRELAANITAGAASNYAKAKAIHDWVQGLYLRYIRRVRPQGQVDFATSIRDVAELDQHPRTVADDLTFIALEVALDRLNGLDAHTVMLPNRTFSHFSTHLVADPFLPVVAARVQLGPSQWEYSDPISSTYYAFGALPWESEGEVALIAAHGQQFVPVPYSPAEHSRTINTGRFELNAEGELDGTAARQMTGHPAEIARYQLRNAAPDTRRAYFRRAISGELKGAEIEIDRVDGLDDPYVPIRVGYHLKWPGFAERTNTRLIFHPCVFHWTQASPFTSTDRQDNFRFPYRWQENDRLTIGLPAGYAIEAKEMPSSIPAAALNYVCKIAQEAQSGRLHYSRDFTSNITLAPPAAARPIFAIYNGITARDQFELVAVRKAPAPKTDTGEAP